MRAEHLKGLLAAERKKDREDATTEQEYPTEGRTTAGPKGNCGGSSEEIMYIGSVEQLWRRWWRCGGIDTVVCQYMV